MVLKAKPYHHGDLRQSLLKAAEDELRETGPEKFSLRGCAKRAGVSHAAPAHHFRDTDALLEALATEGFGRLTEMMHLEREKADADPIPQFIGVGTGYIRFAVENPQLFLLMYGGRSSDARNADLQKSTDMTFSVFVNSIAKIRGQQSFQSDAGWSDVTAAWSTVHGYAHLALSGKMKYISALPFEEQRPHIADILRRSIAA